MIDEVRGPDRTQRDASSIISSSPSSDSGKNEKRKNGHRTRPKHVSPQVKPSMSVRLNCSTASIGGPLCLICCEPIDVHAVGPCSHRCICAMCCLRRRELYHEPECCICKDPCPRVIFTYDETLSYEDLEFKLVLFDRQLNIFFEDVSYYAKVRAVFRFKCPVACCHFVTETSLAQLRAHVCVTHRLIYCDVCLRDRRVFLSEQVLLSPDQLGLHNKHWDGGISESLARLAQAQQHLSKASKGKNKKWTPHLAKSRGHPQCRFCGRRFYGMDQLWEHLNMDHFCCPLCERECIWEYYRDYHQLEKHFQQKHYLCQHPDCRSAKFVVFRSDAELKAHEIAIHGLKSARIQVDFQVGGSENETRGRGGFGGRRRAYSPPSSPAADSLTRDARSLQTGNVRVVQRATLSQNPPQAPQEGAQKQQMQKLSSQQRQQLQQLQQHQNHHPEQQQQQQQQQQKQQKSNQQKQKQQKRVDKQVERSAQEVMEASWPSFPEQPLEQHLPQQHLQQQQQQRKQSDRQVERSAQELKKVSWPHLPDRPLEDGVKNLHLDEELLRQRKKRNVELIAKMTSAIGSERLAHFRAISGLFRTGELDAKEYYESFGETFGWEPESLDVFRELVALLPDDTKRMELLCVHTTMRPSAYEPVRVEPQREIEDWCNFPSLSSELGPSSHNAIVGRREDGRRAVRRQLNSTPQDGGTPSGVPSSNDFPQLDGSSSSRASVPLQGPWLDRGHTSAKDGKLKKKQRRKQKPQKAKGKATLLHFG